MKKFYYLIAMAIMAFTFTSCEDVPAPFGQPVHISGDTEGEGGSTSEYGTADAPLTVAQAIALIDAKSTVAEAYVKGKIYKIDSYNATYHSITYWISDDDGTTTQLQVYSGKGKDGADFAGKEDLTIGQTVTIKGALKNYNGTYEFDKNNEIVSIGDASGGGGSDTGAAKGTGTQSDPFNIAAAIAKCKEVGTTASTEKYYIKGIVVKGGTVSGGYGNVTFDMGDTKESTDLFKAYQVAGTNGEKLADGYEVKVGDEVVIYGPVVTYNTTYETSGKSAAQIVTINGKGTDGSGGDTGGDTGAAKGTGTQADPFNIAAAIAKCKEVGTTASTEKYYIKGIVVKGGTVSGGYGNVTFDMGDTKESTDLFKAYQVAGTDGEKLADGYEVKAGDEVVIYGPVVTYNTTYETSGKSAAQIVTINGKKTNESSGGESGGGDTGGGSSTPTSLTNGDFETWASGQPTGWKSASSASSATLEQSTDAHGGSYAVIVKGGGTANKRLASQEISLTAGSYNFSFWVKATTANKAQCCAGYVPVTNGTAGSYQYKKNGTSTAYETLSTTWSQVSYDFTLDADATICLVVMNPKSSSYSSGEDILVDDATLTKK